LLAPTRRALNEETVRAKTAASMTGIGVPRSSAFWLVQRPVPFCSAASSSFSTSGSAVMASFVARTWAVISIRNDESLPSFQRPNTPDISSGVMPRTRFMMS
jgi:hypothetical protein